MIWYQLLGNWFGVQVSGRSPRDGSIQEDAPVFCWKQCGGRDETRVAEPLPAPVLSGPAVAGVGLLIM
jgi:hypothetical protein